MESHSTAASRLTYLQTIKKTTGKLKFSSPAKLGMIKTIRLSMDGKSPPLVP